jgi:hypothetical protein
MARRFCHEITALQLRFHAAAVAAPVNLFHQRHRHSPRASVPHAFGICPKAQEKSLKFGSRKSLARAGQPNSRGQGCLGNIGNG